LAKKKEVMLKTIKSKLLAVLLLTVFICVISSFFSFSFIERTNKEIYEISSRVERIDNLFLRDVKITRDFFAYETINPTFFISGKSKILDKHNEVCAQINFSIDALILLQADYSFEMNTEIEELRAKFTQYKTKFDAIVKDILIRGFKDYGIEGKMRENAHKLEEYSEEIGLAEILQLRRHEKDFIIRQDDRYIEKFLEQYVMIRNKLRAENGDSLSSRIPAFVTLENYRMYFEKFVMYEKKTGLHNQGGLKRELDLLLDSISKMDNSLMSKASLKGEVFLSRMKLYVLALWSLFVFLCIVFTIIFSSKFSKSIIELNYKVNEFVNSDFTTRSFIHVKDSLYEIDTLSNNFSIMEEHLVNQMNALKERNKEMRTFIYRASNDISVPVSSIKVLTNQARKFIADEQARNYFAKIEQANNKQAEIIDELATVFNIKEAKIEIVEIDPFGLVRNCIQDCKEVPGFEKIVFTMDINLKNKLFTDLTCIKAILKNIIENSVKYSKKDSTTQRITISLREGSEKMLSMTVTDNGIGIKEEYLPQIFEMFFKGTNLSTGMGLGLYIVQNALQKLNGAVEVQSIETKGTTFIIHLPNAVGDTSLAKRIIENKKRQFENAKLTLNYL
jgi:signal transduction histidine kinase